MDKPAKNCVIFVLSSLVHGDGNIVHGGDSYVGERGKDGEVLIGCHLCAILIPLYLIFIKSYEGLDLHK